jgi:hypothetical protein
MRVFTIKPARLSVARGKRLAYLEQLKEQDKQPKLIED